MTAGMLADEAGREFNLARHPIGRLGVSEDVAKRVCDNQLQVWF